MNDGATFFFPSKHPAVPSPHKLKAFFFTFKPSQAEELFISASQVLVDVKARERFFFRQLRKLCARADPLFFCANFVNLHKDGRYFVRTTRQTVNSCDISCTEVSQVKFQS